MALSFDFAIDAEGLFPNKKLDVPRFTSEIQASAITVALDSVVVTGNLCTVTFKAAPSPAEEVILGTLVQSHSGDALITPRDSIKLQVYSVGGRNLVVEGRRQGCTLNTTTTLDLTFAEERELQGALLEVKNFFDGDYVEFFLAHPTLGNLHKWASTLYIPPSGRLDYVTDDAKTVPAGLITRAVYHSVTDTGSAPVMYLAVRTWK